MPKRMDMPLSIVIPTYEMHGKGVQFLENSFEILEHQSFQDFEVVISDNSEDNSILEICKKHMGKLDISYYKNPKKGMAANTNSGISIARGRLIKILYQDDFLAHDDALKDIIENFEDNDNWLITACDNNLIPHYNPRIFTGYNTIGSPSVLTLRNEDPLLFDETLKWLLDCEYYQRLYKKYGEPKVLGKVGVIIGIGDHQETNHLTQEEKNHEYSCVAANN